MKIYKLVLLYIRGLFDNYFILTELLRVSLMAKGVYNTSFESNLIRGFGLAKGQWFKPEEAYHLGLFSPKLKQSDLSQYISKRKMSGIQAKVNPASWFWITESKDIFYKLCERIDISVPKSYGFYYKHSSSWLAGQVFINSESEWHDFIDNNLPETFVIKPARGVYAQGIYLLERVNDGFIDTDNNRYDTKAIYELLSSNEKYDSYIFQERLMNHPAIFNFSPSEYLQSLRVITFIDKNNNFTILYAALKLIMGSGFADNFEKGASGNLKSTVDIRTGRLLKTIGSNTQEPGLIDFELHPQSEKRMDMFKLPCWPELIEMVRNSAYQFLPIRAIGWDIAITSRGPVIIEANIRWDPPNQHIPMNDMVKILVEDSIPDSLII